MHRGAILLCVALVLSAVGDVRADELRVGVFDIDASPPIGSPLAYDPTKGIEVPLRCRGVVIAGAGKPIVLCAIDWIGVGNGGYEFFRTRLASAAKTEPERVAVHALHQHDAPEVDFDADELLAQYGLRGAGFDVPFARDAVERAAKAVEEALASAEPVTHLGLGTGVVEKVASNRRILGEDGKVLHVRYTATRDPAVRAFPVGTIDPELKMISFWNGERPIAVLTYYATHPQSYYRTGLANPDFPGLARNDREKETGTPHIHFNGAGGNIGAGKWNDGSPENRQVLADRVAEGMRKAWESTAKSPISADEVAWEVEPVALPASEHLDEKALLATVQDGSAKPDARFHAAKHLIWLRRCQTRDTIDIGRLSLGKARVLHLPGELFVEYQLAAQKMRPDLFVAMAAYGDYAMGYIGTEIAYSQGGYETGPTASHVAPTVERTLTDAMAKLLKD